MRGGRSWFAVESKSFEISLQEVGGKLSGRIVERSKGFSSLIRFGEFSLRNLLDGVEACCRDEAGKRCSKVWVENGREFRLEHHSNRAGRFIHCMVSSVEAKRFFLYVFLKEGVYLGDGLFWQKSFATLGLIPFLWLGRLLSQSTLGLWKMGAAQRMGQKAHLQMQLGRVMVDWVKQFGFRWGLRRFKRERLS